MNKGNKIDDCFMPFSCFYCSGNCHTIFIYSLLYGPEKDKIKL
jgi:hypothetical protein